MKNKFLTTSMLVAPAALLLMTSQPAFAICNNVTPGGGSIANPADGDVIICDTVGGDQTSRVGGGDSAVAATVNLLSGANIIVSDDGIRIDNVTVDLATGATIQTSGNSNEGIVSFNSSGVASQDITLNDNAQITTTGDDSEAARTESSINAADFTVVLSGDDTLLSTAGDDSDVIFVRAREDGDSTANVTLSGDNAQILATGANADGVRVRSDVDAASATILLSGDNASIAVSGTGADGVSVSNDAAGGSSVNITLESSTSITSTNGTAILVTDANNVASTIDNAGLIQGAVNSIDLSDGDDNVILRTGSSLSSADGVNLSGGDDTVTFVGNGTEDELFRNVETIEINADATGWEIASESTFDDVNVNSGLLTIGANFTVNDDFFLAGGTTVEIAEDLTFTSTIGDGDNAAATVNLLSGSDLIVSGDGIKVDNVTVDLAAGASIQTSGNNNEAITSFNSVGSVSQNITLNDNAQIITTGDSAEAASANSSISTADITLVLSGDDTLLSTTGENSDALFVRALSNGNSTANVTLSGDNAQIITAGTNADGIRVRGDTDAANATVLLSGDNTSITVSGVGADGVAVDSDSTGGSSVNITLESNTSITSADATAILVTNANNQVSTIDNAGLIQGATNSFNLSNGDDTVILRTGSNLSSVDGANLGAGDDTLTFEGNGSEDEIFRNAETVEINADATGWELTGTSTFDDVNVNTGLFTNNGVLTINDLLTVANSARFGGTGTINGDVTNNGTVAIGTSTGTKVINGDYTQGSDGVFEVRLDNTDIDLLDISGTANLDGTLTLIENTSAASFDTPFVFLEADGGITGTFSDIPDLITTSEGITQVNVDIGANQAALTLTAGTGLTNDSTTSNESAVAAALDNAGVANSADVIAITNALNSSGNISNALSSQDGTVTLNAIGSTSAAIGQVTNIVQSRAAIATGNTAISASSSSSDIASIQPAAGGVNRHLWLQAIGGSGQVDSDSTSRGANYRTYGFATGADTELENINASIGTFVAFSNTSSDTKGLNDDSTVKAYQGGIYGAKDFADGWHTNATVSGAYLDFETTRSTALGSASADFDGYGVFASGEVSYDIAEENGITLSPYVGLNASVIYHDSYTEDGAGILNTSVEDETTESLSSEIGVQYSGSYAVNAYTINPTLKLGWAHEFLDQNAQSQASFTSVPTAVFNSEGPEQSRDSAVIGLNFNVTAPDSNIAFYANYDGNVASDFSDHLLTVGLKIKW